MVENRPVLINRKIIGFDATQEKQLYTCLKTIKLINKVFQLENVGKLSKQSKHGKKWSNNDE